ncbi:MAG: hypothetical protein NXH83_17250 [Rhodobacteraceae bacterium]|nr:hypothetical protein [Paracoccaceae bacterium]
MSVAMDDGVKWWTAKLKTALIDEISEVDDAKRGMENAVRGL